MDPGSLIGSARAALATGDVSAALGYLREAVAEGPNPAARQLLGGLLFFDDDLIGAHREGELAFREWRSVGDSRSAALIAADLADLHTSGIGNPVVGHGWISRARRLLLSEGRCAELGLCGARPDRLCRRRGVPGALGGTSSGADNRVPAWSDRPVTLTGGTPSSAWRQRTPPHTGRGPLLPAASISPPSIGEALPSGRRTARSVSRFPSETRIRPIGRGSPTGMRRRVAPSLSGTTALVGPDRAPGRLRRIYHLASGQNFGQRPKDK